MIGGICKECGGRFWESEENARGSDLCDACEIYERSLVFSVGQSVVVAGRAATVRLIDLAGVHVEFADCPEIGSWAHHPDDVEKL